MGVWCGSVVWECGVGVLCRVCMRESVVGVWCGVGVWVRGSVVCGSVV